MRSRRSRNTSVNLMLAVGVNGTATVRVSKRLTYETAAQQSRAVAVPASGVLL